MTKTLEEEHDRNNPQGRKTINQVQVDLTKPDEQEVKETVEI